jgi:Uri superfamily endonuclease
VRREAVIEHVLATLPGSTRLAGNIDRAPSGPGAYVLLLHLSARVDFARPGLDCTFLPGWYAYAGSARGSGGIRARVRRHLRPDKIMHWHIDSLTAAADAIEAFAVEQGDECELAASLARSGRFAPGPRGFGSSDCARCATHLFIAKKRRRETAN